jgi:hypothetical protein
MPLPIPVLDDRRFHDLVEEARALIPTHAPDWTNHNASDPGITLIELFAYLTEALIYRLDRITPDNVCAFLDLLDGSVERKPEGSAIPVRNTRGRPLKAVDDLGVEVRDTVLALRRLDRAVTEEDYEQLARRPEVLRSKGLQGKVRPLRCFAGVDLRTVPPVRRTDHVSLVVVMGRGAVVGWPGAVHDIEASIEPCRPLGTQFHVVSPVPLPVILTITAQPDQRELRDKVARDVTDWLHPVWGGWDGQGWPLGRSIYLSELYVFVGSLPGVADVREITVDCGDRDRILREAGAGPASTVVGIRLEAYECVNAEVRVNLRTPGP